MDITGLFKAISDMFLEMAPYLMLGLFFVGLMHLFISKDMVVKHIGQSNFSSVFKAAIFGIPLPLCSCGVIPTSVYLAKNGASKSSVVSFLIATPQTGIDSIMATYGMMGWVFAIFRPIAALSMGIAGGVATKLFGDKTGDEKDEELDKHINKDVYSGALISKDAKITDKIKSMLKYSFVDFLDDIVVQFVIGIILAGIIAFIIPDDFFANSVVDNGILGMLLMIVVGVPMYVCATASIPIAVALMMKGFSPGVAFVFLAVGPATNAASFAILSKALGKKITLFYVAIISISAMAFGLLLDEIFRLTGLDAHAMMMNEHNHNGFLTYEMKLVIGLVFLALIIMALYRKYIREKILKRRLDMNTASAKKISIEGMSCNHCVMNVKNAISKVEGIKEIEVLLNENAAYVEGDFDLEKVKKSIEDVGYKVVG